MAQHVWTDHIDGHFPAAPVFEKVSDVAPQITVSLNVGLPADNVYMDPRVEVVVVARKKKIRSSAATRVWQNDLSGAMVRARAAGETSRGAYRSEAVCRNSRRQGLDHSAGSLVQAAI